MEAEDDSDVPGTGAVFTFGKSQFGDNSPNKFWIRDDRVCQVVCGDEHTVFVAESGRVFTFGINEWGQLGLGHKKLVRKPTRIKALKAEKVTQVACGRSHTILATESGKLFSFGANSDGQLGLGHTDDVSSPTEIQGIDNQKCSSLAAGADYSLALFENGSVFVWGSNSDGQLGLGEETETWQPVKLPIDEKVSQISSGYYHSAVVTENGDVYTFGETETGKLGHGDSIKDNKVPQKVEGVGNKVTQVACGGKHTAIITADGKLYTCGEGANGQLGHGTTLLSTDKPALVTWPKTTKIRKVSCGENHTAVITERGQLFTFGDGRHGKLGLGEENFANQFLPSLVQRFSHFTVEEVACGGCHTLVTAKPRLENGDVVSEEEEEEMESEDEQFTFKRGEWNGSIRNSLDLNGSFSARNRRREKLPDPGDTINRTMPSLNSSLSSRPLAPLSATLPALGSRGANHLNRGKLPSLFDKEPMESNSAPPDDAREDEESGVSVTPEDTDEEADKPAIQKTSTATTHSAPRPKPRPVPRKQEHIKTTPVPALRSKPSHPEKADSSDVEDLKPTEIKEDSVVKDSRGESEDEEKIDKQKKKKKSKKDDKKKDGNKKVEKESDEEEESRKEEEIREDPPESEEEDEEEKPKKKEKKKKEKKKDKSKDKKKKKEESEEEEDEDVKEKDQTKADDSEEEELPKKETDKKKKKSKVKIDKGKDKKKKVTESEEEEEEQGTDDEHNKKDQKKPDEESADEEDDVKEAESAEDTKKKEEKKEEPKPQEKKKSKTCTIL